MSNDISVYKWKDRGTKCVLLASSFHDSSVQSSVLRTDATCHREPVPCPLAVQDYNMNMGGVDKFDQYMSAY